MKDFPPGTLALDALGDGFKRTDSGWVGYLLSTDTEGDAGDPVPPLLRLVPYPSAEQPTSYRTPDLAGVALEEFVRGERAGEIRLIDADAEALPDGPAPAKAILAAAHRFISYMLHDLDSLEECLKSQAGVTPQTRIGVATADARRALNKLHDRVMTQWDPAAGCRQEPLPDLGAEQGAGAAAPETTPGK